MDLVLREWFDRLELWLEATSGYLSQVPPSVTFVSTDPADLPLPDPRYLALHAACARAAHFLGAGAHIGHVLHNLEKARVLAQDGSSADALNAAL
ncbi:hypothetical protein BOTBODRAFT_138059, partial [Botryobasidium botryosum FD-172 SS1]